MTRMSIAERVQEDLKRKEEYKKQTGGNLFVSDEAFLKRFWDEKLNLSKRQVPVRVDRHHYMYSLDEKGEIIQADRMKGFPGFGGARFVIEFFDGRIVETNNLWYQGEIPTDYDESLPDNARFIKE